LDIFLVHELIARLPDPQYIVPQPFVLDHNLPERVGLCRFANQAGEQVTFPNVKTPRNTAPRRAFAIVARKLDMSGKRMREALSTKLFGPTPKYGLMKIQDLGKPRDQQLDHTAKTTRIGNLRASP
jgi:hypothetical protein